MDGTFLCPDCWMERCKLCYERSMVYGSANRCILTELYYFLLGTRNLNRYNPKEIHRRNQFKRAMGESKTVPFPGNTQGVTKHKCAVCGRTEKDDPNLEFRFLF